MKSFRKQMISNQQDAKEVRTAVLNLALQVGASSILPKDHPDFASTPDYATVVIVLSDDSQLLVRQVYAGMLSDDANALRATYNALRANVATEGFALEEQDSEGDHQYLAAVTLYGLRTLDGQLVDGDGKPLTGKGLSVNVHFVDDTYATFVVEAEDGGVRFGVTTGDTDIPLAKVDMKPISNDQKSLQKLLESVNAKSEEELKLDPDAEYDHNFWAALVSGISTASAGEYDLFPVFV